MDKATREAFQNPEGLMDHDGWATGREEAILLFQTGTICKMIIKMHKHRPSLCGIKAAYIIHTPTVYSRLAKLEYGAAIFEQKIGAASELAADAALWAKEARAIAASSQRQSSKVPYHPLPPQGL